VCVCVCVNVCSCALAMRKQYSSHKRCLAGMEEKVLLRIPAFDSDVADERSIKKLFSRSGLLLTIFVYTQSRMLHQ
jgi:hypothetical protein